MPKLLLLEEYHLSLFVPTVATDAECDAIRKILSSRSFRNQLHKAMKDLLARNPALSKPRLAVTR